MGCGASSSTRYKEQVVAEPGPPKAQDHNKREQREREGVRSYRQKDIAAVDSHGVPSPTSPTRSQGQPSPTSGSGPGDAAEAPRAAKFKVPISPPLRVEEFDAPQELGPGCRWWADHAPWIAQKAHEILGAYNSFFDHIGLRKGWRTAPFGKDEVQAPFQAAAEVVAVVRARLDEQTGGGVVLRQLEGSAMNFLWGWDPNRQLGASHQALEEFFRGLVFATLSDGRGLVEGLDSTAVEHYVGQHPIVAVCRAHAAANGEGAAAAGGAAAVEASGLPISPGAGAAGADGAAADGGGGAAAAGEVPSTVEAAEVAAAVGDAEPAGAAVAEAATGEGGDQSEGATAIVAPSAQVAIVAVAS